MNRNMCFLLLISLLLIENRHESVVLKIVNPNLIPIKNKKIKIIGCNKVINAVTDNNGLVELCNTQYGKYIAIIESDKYILTTNCVNISFAGIYTLIIKKAVYSEICGIVSDKENNTPIEQSIVILFKREKNTGKYIPYKRITTDLQGRYSFKYIPCGAYRIKCIV